MMENLRTTSLIRRPALSIRVFTGRRMLAIAVRIGRRTPFCFGLANHYTAALLRAELEASDLG